MKIKGAAVKLLQGGSSPNKSFSLKQAPVVDAQPPGRTEALRKAKQDAGIPRSQQPERLEKVPLTQNGKPILDKEGKPIMTREYHYTRGDGSEVVIQDHGNGHQFGDGGIGDQGPHFNVRPAANTRNGKVQGTAEHYYFGK